MRIRLAMLGVATSALMLSACQQADDFKMADTNGDGRLDLAEFKRYMLEAVYAKADANGDKKVTFEEWKAVNPDAKIEKFREADKHGDGFVTPEESKQYFDREGTMEDLFKKIDSNSDGYLSQEDVANFMKRAAEQSGTAYQKMSRTTQN